MPLDERAPFLCELHIFEVHSANGDRSLSAIQLRTLLAGTPPNDCPLLALREHELTAAMRRHLSCRHSVPIPK